MSYQSDVEKFMRAGDQPISKELSIDSKEADLYVNLITEEYKETSVRFNTLALGAVGTEMLAEAFPGYSAPTSAEQMSEFFYECATNGHKMFNGKVLPVSISTP